MFDPVGFEDPALGIKVCCLSKWSAGCHWACGRGVPVQQPWGSSACTCALPGQGYPTSTPTPTPTSHLPHATPLQVHRGIYEAAQQLYDRFLPLVLDHLAATPFARFAFTVSPQ